MSSPNPIPPITIDININVGRTEKKMNDEINTARNGCCFPSSTKLLHLSEISYKYQTRINCC